MNPLIPRLRIFAGPNGSGKSTIKDVINKEILGVYINPDDIEKEIKEYDFLNLSCYDIETDEKEILSFFDNSTLLKKFDLLDETELLRFNEYSWICEITENEKLELKDKNMPLWFYEGVYQKFKGEKV